VSGRRAGLGLLLLGGFGLFEGLQGSLPRVFQFGCHVAMGRIDVAALAFPRGGLIAQPLEMLGMGLSEALGLLLSLGQRLRIDIEFHGGEGLKKRVDDSGINRSRRLGYQQDRPQCIDTRGSDTVAGGSDRWSGCPP
jgi:hypothetical protein